jgi:hypothetical protein
MLILKEIVLDLINRFVLNVHSVSRVFHEQTFTVMETLISEHSIIWMLT